MTDKPVLVTLVYYECPMLCTQVLNGLVKGMKPLGLTPGEDYEILTVSIDPSDQPELAAKKKANYLRLLGDEAAGKGWHFLSVNAPSGTGDGTSTESRGESPSRGKSSAPIDALADAVGFRYFYDPVIEEYAHPAGAVVLTPSGRVSRYLFDIDFSSRDLRLALVEASENKIGSLLDELYLRCYHWDPTTGKYGLAVASVLRIFGTLTVLAIGGLVFVLLRRERRMRREPGLQAGA
jgi:protein SCO1